MSRSSIRNIGPNAQCEEKLGRHCGVLFEQMRRHNLVLRCQCSDSVEAVQRGGGFIWWIDPGGYRVPPAAALKLSKSDFLEPLLDGLLDGASQSFTVRSRVPA